MKDLPAGPTRSASSRQPRALESAGPAIAEVLEALLPAERPIHLHEPELGAGESAAVLECVESGLVSSIGPFVERFETDIASLTGASNAVATVNGTAGLTVALYAAGVRPGDEVIVPALSFVATANAVTHLGATPRFVDISEDTLGIDPYALATYLGKIGVPCSAGLMARDTGARIAAIVPVHIFGHPAEMDEIVSLAHEWGLAVVEDAAESLGSHYRGRHTGTLGDVGVFSFNGNKIITTGGGGIVVTSDDGLAQRIRHLATTAKVPQSWDLAHDAVAWNFRMPSINAALGVAQMKRLPTLLENKRRLASAYKEAFEATPSVDFVDEPAGTSSNFWLSTVRIRTKEPLRDVLATLQQLGFECRPAWRPLTLLPMYRQAPSSSVPNALRAAAELVNLPSSARFGEGL